MSLKSELCLVHAVQVGGALGVHQVVVGVHVDSGLRGPGHDGDSQRVFLE